MDHYGNHVEIKKKERKKIRGEGQFRTTVKEVAIWF